MVDFHYKKTGLLKVLFMSLILTFNALNIQAQSFSQSNLNFNGFGGISNGTSLMFGPDGRLYVAEYTGTIKIYTIDRIEGNNYTVTSAEFLTGLNNIKNHNDDGSTDTSTYREFTGLTVAGTPTNPIIYATSSDFRIGGGGGGGNGDLGLDTNSGVITRFSWNGNTWDEVDLVRGLPRSEENHATNGLEFITVNGEDYLIVASGGHTNGGAPSINFAYTSEYALSAAILSVNLSMLNNMPVLNDNGRKYIYDIPTLDDPSRPNVNGITDPDIAGYDGVDINDPFGGNDGLNQAMVVTNGPVQIFSPGYRNAFDLVVTENGAVYCTDNGANGGWGGFPKNEGMDPFNPATNDYVLGEPGGNSATPDGEMINNKDHLSLITLDIQNYSFGSFYGGHPNPTRANPTGAGLYINPDVTGNTGAVFRTMIFDPDGSRTNSTSNPSIALPANWPPVPVSEANLQEGDWRGPGISNPDGPDDAIITTWGTNTNGIDEYTASNFNNAMKGDLLAGVNTGKLRRVELNADGSLKALTPSWASGLGGDALGVTCNSDSEIFPGTIWVVTLNGKLIVLEPQDFGICLQPNDAGYSPTADNDFDGYTNQDEIDNGNDICSGGSQPNDFDKDAGGVLVSDLNDSDDDNDGILDSLDPFQLGDPLTTGSDAFTLPVFNELFSSNTTLNGYSGLGFTGMMNNGLSNPNWLNWLDRRDDPNAPNPNDVLGGAIGAMTMQMTSGTALGTTNNQEKGFQYGVQVNQNSGVFTVVGSLSNLNTSLQLYGNSNAPNGELGIYIGDGTQSNYIKFVITPDGLTALQEINDIDQTPINLAISSQNRPNGAVNLYFVIDPSNGEITLEYSFDAGARTFFGTINSQGNILSAIQQSGTDLAVGLIGSSNATGVEVEGTWDFLNVSGNGPGIVTVLPDLDRLGGDADEEIDLNTYFNDDNGVGNLTYSVAGNTNTDIVAVIATNLLTLSYPSTPTTSAITIRATDLDANFVEQTFNVSVSAIEEPLVLYRVNAGGPAITSLDGGVAWGGDTRASKSPFLSQAGNNNTSGFSMISYSQKVDLSTTPTDIYNSERYDATAGAPNMSYSFPVSSPGTYEVRLYMGNGWSGTSGAGARIFDVLINGVLYPALNDLDLSGTFGHQVGSVITESVEISGSSIDISFIHGAIENPLINGIEILNSAGVVNTPISLSAVADQLNAPGESLDGSLVVSASGGDGSLTYSMTGAPLGVSIEPTNGQIGGEIDASADSNSPYTVIVSVDDSDGLTTDVVTTSFTWTIQVVDIPISLGAMADQLNAPGESLDGSLIVSASGGDGVLVYSMTGAPLGVSIEPTNGQIWGEIDAAADSNSPYTVIVSVDDSDGLTTDVVTTSFTWTVQVVEPYITTVLPNLNRLAGDADEEIDLDTYFNDDNGVGNLTYSVAGNTNTDIAAVIAANLLTLSYPSTAATSTITIRATDLDANFVKQTFNVSVSAIEEPLVLYRVNAGGPAIASLDGGVAWGGDTRASKSPYLSQAGNNNTSGFSIISYSPEVDLSTTPTDIYTSERYDATAGAPNLSYSFPVSQPGTYEVRLYMGNGWSGTSGAGARIFDVSINGVLYPALNDLDLSGTFGHQVGSVITEIVEISGSSIDISFIHGAIENPLINGIEILNPSSAVDTPISISALADQFNAPGALLDGSLVVAGSGGDGALTYSMTGAPLGVSIEPTNGQIGGTIDTAANLDSPYTVIVSVDDSDGLTTDVVTTSFTWTIQVVNTPISLSAVADQLNTPGELLDGSLVVSASGGDGALTYSMTGAPLGVSIEPTNGQIGGEINAAADLDSPYTVIVSVDDSDGLTTDVVTTSFTWTIQVVDIPISLSAVADQLNTPGESLDGSLIVSASGGDGSLTYSMTGAPLGVSIESTNGQIGGEIDAAADSNSPYTVIVSVDDSDGLTTDVVTTSFTWTVQVVEPYITTVLPNLNRLGGDADEEIDLDTYFNDDNGVGNLTYSVEGNTNTDIAAVIATNLLTLSYPSTAATSAITIRATDLDANFVEQTFNVSVSVIEEPLVLYRVNAGGPAIASLDGDVAWGGDTRASKSPYLSQAGNNNTSGYSMISYVPEVDLSTTPTDIYTSERYDATAGAPNMSYSFPVSQPGTYEVRLYMGNGWSGTSGAGARIFDVLINGVLYPALNDLDLSGTFGHQVGSVITETVEISGSSIDISFIHGAIENPLINGIEILNSTGLGAPISLGAMADQLNAPGESLEGSLVVSASGGDGALTYSITGAPLGVSIEPTNGQIGGEIDASADLDSPYTVSVSVDDSDGITTDVVTTSFTWTITNEIQPVWKNKNEAENYTGRHECSFVQAGDKFYLLGGRENSKTLDIYDYTSNSWLSLANSAPFEFNHFQAIEYQGLIWVIGSFKNNSFPSESPTENIWIFDPANQEWIQGPAIPTSRQRGSTGLVEYNDKFYIVGGNTNGHNGGYVAWFDEYDPATGIWTILEDAPRARDHFHAAIIDDKIYAVGGRLSGGVGGTFKPVISEVDVYDLSLKSWTTLPSGSNLPSPRGAPAVVNFNDKILVIGGEVQDELIYNVSTTDAVKVTEEFDPSTGNWVRKADLNSERHGTQALVSGNGVFILGGSPNLAGGNQKNLEYYGEDAPIGVPSMASDLSAPESIQISKSVPEDIILQTINGNMGVYITSMEFSGPNMNNFSIVSGEVSKSLLKPNSSHIISVSYSGATPGETATLTINYGGGYQVSILLESVLDPLNAALTQSREFQSSFGSEENIQSSLEFDVQIYPNPSSVESFLKISDPTIEVHKIYLYDFSGRLIKYFVGKESYINDGLYRVNLQGLPDGVYLVKLETSIFNNLSLRLIIKN
jgi:hypothetical protein